MKIIEGNLLELALQNKFDAIAHGLNCFCTAPYAGIANQFERIFSISDYGWEQECFSGKYNRLGNLDYKSHYIKDEKVFDSQRHSSHPEKEKFHELLVINAYTQYKPGKDLNKIALLLCLQKLEFLCRTKNLKLGIPLIGGGIAGGDPKQIINLMHNAFKDIDVTLVLTPEMFKQMNI